MSQVGIHTVYTIEQALTNKGVKRKEMTVAEFRKLCAEYAYEQVERQREQFKRLGVRAGLG